MRRRQVDVGRLGSRVVEEVDQTGFDGSHHGLVLKRTGSIASERRLNGGGGGW